MEMNKFKKPNFGNLLISNTMSLPIIPHDLIIEIFSWLPVKPLVRFTSVAKLYKSLIFLDPNFRKLHFQRSPKHSHVILTMHDAVDVDGEDTWIESWLVTPYSVRHLIQQLSSNVNEDECRRFNNDTYHVISSANGLVCLISHKKQEDKDENICFRFWNPTLRLRSKKSPTLTVGNHRVKVGFGYDDSSHTFKVVAVFKDRTTNKREGRVHCMGDSCWRETLACPEFPVLLGSELFVNGSINWLARNEQKVIFSFDLQEETGKYLLLPAGFREVAPKQPTLAVFRGCLCLYYDHMKTHFVLWEMRDFGVQDSWTRLVNVSYVHLQFAHDWRLVPLSENGDVMMLFSKEVPDDVIIYNRRDDRVELIEVPDTQIWYADQHMQSLAVPLPRPD